MIGENHFILIYAVQKIHVAYFLAMSRSNSYFGNMINLSLPVFEGSFARRYRTVKTDRGGG